MRTPSRVWREQGGHDDTRVGGGESRENSENAPLQKYLKVIIERTLV